MSHRRIIARNVLGVGVSVATAWLLYVYAIRPLASPSPSAPPQASAFGGSVPASQHRENVISRWKALPFTAVGNTTTTDTLTESILAQTDIVGNVPDAVARELAARLAREVWARGATPSEYANLVADELATRWTVESDPGWRGIAGWFMEEHKRSVSGSATREMLEQFIKDLDERYQGRLDGACVSEQGCRVRVSKIRVREQLWLEFDSALPRAERDYWMRSNSGTAYRFRVPKVTLDDVLRRDGVATVAACMIVVRTTGGENYNLCSSWFRDPAIDAWVCDEVVRKNWNSNVFVYR